MAFYVFMNIINKAAHNTNDRILIQSLLLGESITFNNPIEGLFLTFKAFLLGYWCIYSKKLLDMP